MLTQQLISDRTGFDRGELFASEAEVRAYFTLELMAQNFGGHIIHVHSDGDGEDYDACVTGYSEINPNYRWTNDDLDEIDDGDDSDRNYYTQAELTDMADAVIHNRWHMA